MGGHFDNLPIVDSAKFRVGENIGGLEHDVFFDPRKGRYYKISKTESGGLNKSRQEYFQRLRGLNALWPELGYRTEGVTPDNKPIISMNAFGGGMPTAKEIHDHLKAKGFEHVPFSTANYRNSRTGAFIGDAHEENWKKLPGGGLVPIDVDFKPGKGSALPSWPQAVSTGATAASWPAAAPGETAPRLPEPAQAPQAESAQVPPGQVSVAQVPPGQVTAAAPWPGTIPAGAVTTGWPAAAPGETAPALSSAMTAPASAAPSPGTDSSEAVRPGTAPAPSSFPGQGSTGTGISAQEAQRILARYDKTPLPAWPKSMAGGTAPASWPAQAPGGEAAPSLPQPASTGGAGAASAPSLPAWPGPGSGHSFQVSGWPAASSAAAPPARSWPQQAPGGSQAAALPAGAAAGPGTPGPGASSYPSFAELMGEAPAPSRWPNWAPGGEQSPTMPGGGAGGTDGAEAQGGLAGLFQELLVAVKGMGSRSERAPGPQSDGSFVPGGPGSMLNEGLGSIFGSPFDRK